MTTPLGNHLNFDGMTKYGNDILLGLTAEIPNFDTYKKDTHII